LGTNECRQLYDETVVEGRPLPQRTAATIVDPLKFFEHIRTVAGQGFALDIEECEVGLSCVGAPIYDRSGLVVAALSISGPSSRLGIDHLMRHVVPRVSAAATSLSSDLGYGPR
jgi:DNA-binding IclR family transcriptional regulator